MPLHSGTANQHCTPVGEDPPREQCGGTSHLSDVFRTVSRHLEISGRLVVIASFEVASTCLQPLAYGFLKKMADVFMLRITASVQSQDPTIASRELRLCSEVAPAATTDTDEKHD